MKLVHVPRRFTRHAWGGTETVVQSLATAQTRAGHDPVIHTSRALDATPFERIGGVPVHRHRHLYPWLRLDPRTRDQMDRVGGNLFSLGLWKALRRAPMDLLHLHTGKRVGGIVRTIARSKRVPYVLTLHGGLANRTRAPVAFGTGVPEPRLEWGRALGAVLGSRRVAQDAAAVVHLDPADAPVLEQMGVRNVVHIPNGVDVPRFGSGDGPAFRRRLGIPVEAPVVAVIGRIDRQKNQLAALRAMARWRARVPDVRLLLVGPVTDPGYRAELLAEMARLGLGRSVHLMGGLSGTELTDAYHAADLVLVPSIHEPFGIVVLEAWAAGRPVVAHRTGGIPTFVSDGADALLVEPGEDSELDRAVLRVLGDPSLALRLAREGRRRAQHEFDWSRIAARYESLYEGVLSRRAA